MLRRPGSNRRGLRGFGAAAPAAAWTPASITGVAEWLRADLGTTDAGAGACSAWQGQIAGETIAQGVSGARPTITTRDGQAVLSFDGGDLLQGAYSTITLSQPYTLAVVLERTGAASSQGVVDGDDISNRGLIYKTAANWFGFAGSNGPTQPIGSGEQAIVCTFNGAASVMYLDDLTTPSAAANPGTQVPNGLTVGGLYSAGSLFTGFVWEVIVINQVISAPDLADLGAYLDARYAGLTLTY